MKSQSAFALPLGTPVQSAILPPLDAEPFDIAVRSRTLFPPLLLSAKHRHSCRESKRKRHALTKSPKTNNTYCPKSSKRSSCRTTPNNRTWNKQHHTPTVTPTAASTALPVPQIVAHPRLRNSKLPPSSVIQPKPGYRRALNSVTPTLETYNSV